MDAKSSNQSILDGMYPFLANTKQDPVAMSNALRESVRQKTAQHLSVVEHFFTEQAEALIVLAHDLAHVYRNNGRLYCMGNGGSSSDAAHIAVEFQHPVTTGRPALPAFDLSSDKTMLTAVANDVGFAQVYSRQVIALVNPEDALIGVSTSGNSANLINGFRQAQRKGALTIGLTGGDGGEMAQIGLNHCLVAPSDSIHRVQECHVAIYHMLWDLVHTLLADDRGKLPPPNYSDTSHKEEE